MYDDAPVGNPPPQRYDYLTRLFLNLLCAEKDKRKTKNNKKTKQRRKKKKEKERRVTRALYVGARRICSVWLMLRALRWLLSEGGLLWRCVRCRQGRMTGLG